MAAPVLQYAYTDTANPTHVILVYDQTLFSGSLALSKFDLLVDGLTANEVSANASGSQVLYILTDPISSGNTVTLSYTAGASGARIQNESFELAGSFTNQPVTWGPPPAAVITFPSLPTKTTASADFAPGATSTNTVTTITYASSNTAVATIVSGNVHIVGAGTSNITASQAAGNGYDAAADVTKLLTVNSNTMASANNNISGKLVSFAISTDGGTTYKNVVCSSGDIKVSGTQTAGAETPTRCGVLKAPGTSGWTMSVAGIANTTPSTGEISQNELALLFNDASSFDARVQYDTDPTDYYRQGSGFFSAYDETAPVDGFVNFTATVNINGILDLTV